MGLNWGQGLENAAAGLNRMAGQKNKEADLLYQDMAEKNRLRFRAGESQKQRDFLSSEAETRREWEEPFKTKGLALQETQIKISGDIKKIQTQMQGEQNKMSNYWQQLSHELSERKAALEAMRLEQVESANVIKEKRLTAKEGQAAYEFDIGKLGENLTSAEEKKTIFNEAEHPALDEEISKAKAAIEAREQQNTFDKEVGKLSKKQEALYTKAFDGLTLKDRAHKHQVSIAYAKMSEKQRGQISVVAKNIMKTELQDDPAGAQAKAIMMISSGKKIDLSEPPEGSTQVDLAAMGKANLAAVTKTPQPEGNDFVPPPVEEEKGWLNRPIAELMAGDPEERAEQKEVMALAIKMATENGDMQLNRIAPAKEKMYLKEAREALGQKSEFIAKGGATSESVAAL
ncbi:MAG: hypothetical protein V3R93_06515 [Candidatus Hydrothermarchaeaceae archaeon]